MKPTEKFEQENIYFPMQNGLRQRFSPVITFHICFKIHHLEGTESQERL
jgi:hypothetical protein